MIYRVGPSQGNTCIYWVKIFATGKSCLFRRIHIFWGRLGVKGRNCTCHSWNELCRVNTLYNSPTRCSCDTLPANHSSQSVWLCDPEFPHNLFTTIEIPLAVSLMPLVPYFVSLLSLLSTNPGDGDTTIGPTKFKKNVPVIHLMTDITDWLAPVRIPIPITITWK